MEDPKLNAQMERRGETTCVARGRPPARPGVWDRDEQQPHSAALWRTRGVFPGRVHAHAVHRWRVADGAPRRAVRQLPLWPSSDDDGAQIAEEIAMSDKKPKVAIVPTVQVLRLLLRTMSVMKVSSPLIMHRLHLRPLGGLAHLVANLRLCQFVLLLCLPLPQT